MAAGIFAFERLGVERGDILGVEQQRHDGTFAADSHGLVKGDCIKLKRIFTPGYAFIALYLIAAEQTGVLEAITGLDFGQAEEAVFGRDGGLGYGDLDEVFLA